MTATPASGVFSVSGSAPESPDGESMFLSMGQTSGKVGAAVFSMSPVVNLIPSSGAPGSTVTGTGFAAYEPVDIYLAPPANY